MKFSRPLCLLLFLLLLFSFFVVPSSAAENLVNPNLAQWDNVNTGNIPDSDLSEVTVTSYVDFYRLNADYVGVVGDSNPTHFWVGHMFDTSSLKAGRKYNFSIHIPSVSELKSNGSLSGLADSHFTDAYNGGVLAVTFGTLKSDGSINSILELLTIDSSNYMDLMGTDYVYNFTCPDYSGGSPAIFIHLYHTSASLKSNPMFFLGNDMALVDESEVDEDNFIIKFIDNISSLFDDLSDSFENAINALLGGIGGWFQKFGNFLLYFTWSDEVPENPFESEEGPLDKVEGFFDDMIDYLRNLSTDLTNVVDSVTAGIYLFDVFTERFPWVKTLCIFAFAMIIVSRFIGL